jgi:predicted RNA-binding Zn-ribbon protein involved in translation (DUF1610 family)
MPKSETMRKFTCPVCGFPEFDQPAWNPDNGIPSFEICPSCGCEFGYHDATSQAKEKYRRNWVKQGAPCFKPELKPHNWSLKIQLKKTDGDLDDLI